MSAENTFHQMRAGINSAKTRIESANPEFYKYGGMLRFIADIYDIQVMTEEDLWYLTDIAERMRRYSSLSGATVSNTPYFWLTDRVNRIFPAEVSYHVTSSLALETVSRTEPITPPVTHKRDELITHKGPDIGLVSKLFELMGISDGVREYFIWTSPIVDSQDVELIRSGWLFNWTVFRKTSRKLRNLVHLVEDRIPPKNSYDESEEIKKELRESVRKSLAYRYGMEPVPVDILRRAVEERYELYVQNQAASKNKGINQEDYKTLMETKVRELAQQLFKTTGIREGFYESFMQKMIELDWTQHAGRLRRLYEQHEKQVDALMDTDLPREIFPVVLQIDMARALHETSYSRNGTNLIQIRRNGGSRKIVGLPRIPYDAITAVYADREVAGFETKKLSLIPRENWIGGIIPPLMTRVDPTNALCDRRYNDPIDLVGHAMDRDIVPLSGLDFYYKSEREHLISMMKKPVGELDPADPFWTKMHMYRICGMWERDFRVFPPAYLHTHNK